MRPNSAQDLKICEHVGAGFGFPFHGVFSWRQKKQTKKNLPTCSGDSGKTSYFQTTLNLSGRVRTTKPLYVFDLICVFTSQHVLRHHMVEVVEVQLMLKRGDPH